MAAPPVKAACRGPPRLRTRKSQHGQGHRVAYRRRPLAGACPHHAGPRPPARARFRIACTLLQYKHGRRLEKDTGKNTDDRPRRQQAART
jgi:hypothetical protein